MMILKKDEETGEAISRLNTETGEEELISSTSNPVQIKKSFKVPCSGSKQKKYADTSPTFAAVVLFLLPTIVLFYPILAVFAVCGEICLHIWAHRKNKSLKNQNLFYQSPLHIICKEFCGSCREEESKIKISKFQEKRADRFKKYGLEYVRRIVT